MAVSVALVGVVDHVPHAGEWGGRQEDHEGEELRALVKDLQALETSAVNANKEGRKKGYFASAEPSG